MISLLEFLTRFYRPLRLRGKSPATVRLYECTIRAFAKTLGRVPALEDLEELVLANHLDQRAREVAPLTVEKERSQLMSLARLAVERRMLDMLPACQPGPMPRRTPEALTLEEMKALRAAAIATTGTVAGVPAGDWWIALVDVLWESGERIGAILSTNRADFKAPYLLVRAESRKGGKADRLYELSRRTCEELERARAPGRPELFYVGEKSGNAIYHHAGHVFARAGLHGRRQRFHAIRRTAASFYAAAGGNAQQMLGHASGATTSRYYLDPRICDTGPKPHQVLPAID